MPDAKIVAGCCLGILEAKSIFYCSEIVFEGGVGGRGLSVELLYDCMIW